MQEPAEPCRQDCFPQNIRISWVRYIRSIGQLDALPAEMQQVMFSTNNLGSQDGKITVDLSWKQLASKGMPTYRYEGLWKEDCHSDVCIGSNSSHL